MIYVVKIQEVHLQSVTIEATSIEDARRKVADGEGDFVDGSLTYSHTLDPDTWTIEEERRANAEA